MSYTNNPRSILAGAGITIAPTTGTGAEVVTISSSGVPTLAVRVAVATPVAVSATTDDVISVQVTPAATVTVNLPAGTLGKTFTIKDGLGLAAAITPINVTPNLAELIDGVNAPAVINAPWGSLTFVYDGTQWIVV
jgi:hypothetical protein